MLLFLTELNINLTLRVVFFNFVTLGYCLNNTILHFMINKKTLVFGASLKADRYSNFAIHRLVNSGHQVVAYGLKPGMVSGIQIDTQLIDYHEIDTVTLYMNAAIQQQYYNYIVSLHPKRVIFNPGTENHEFYQILEKNGIAYEVACTLVLLSTNQY